MSQDKSVKNSRLKQAIEAVASQVRSISRQQYGLLWDAYQITSDLLSALVEQGAKESQQAVSESASKRLSLTANLIQSSTIVEHIISSGYYSTSAAVLRHNMETLARIIELRQGKSVIGKNPPNVGVLPMKLAQNYGRLSELYHTSGGELLSCFAESSEGKEIATVMPHYLDEWAKRLIFLHIAFMVMLAIEIGYLHHEIYVGNVLTNIEEPINTVMGILVRTGFLERLDT